MKTKISGTFDFADDEYCAECFYNSTLSSDDFYVDEKFFCRFYKNGGVVEFEDHQEKFFAAFDDN